MQADENSYISRSSKLLKSFDKALKPVRKVFVTNFGDELADRILEDARQEYTKKAKGTLMKMMKIITLHPLVIVVERICASASEIRRTWDPSPCDGRGN